MKSIKEKELLVNFARSMGQDVDADLVEEVESFKTIKQSVHKSIKENIFKDLSEAFKKSDIKKETKEVSKIDYPLPPSLDDLVGILNETIIEEAENELVQENTESERTQKTTSTSHQPKIKEDTDTSENTNETNRDDRRQPSEQTLPDLAAKFISEAPKNSFQQPDPLVVSDNLDAIRGKLKFLEQWISKVSMAGPGGGEVNLRYLDDVDRPNIADDLYLRYESSLNKFTFDRGHKNAFYGAFQSTETQTCGANTAVALTYNQTDFSYGITVTNNSRVVIQHPGLYNAQFSVQLTNSGTQIDRVYIWLRQNGQDVIGSAGKIDVPSSHGGAPGAILIGWNFYVNTTAANEYFEFMWFTPDEVHVTIPTLPAQGPVAGVSPYIPSTASVVLTVSPIKIE
jgi:hypothetical protein